MAPRLRVAVQRHDRSLRSMRLHGHRWNCRENLAKTGDDATEARARFEALRQERCDQVEQGMPLCTLPLDVSVKNVAARAVACMPFALTSRLATSSSLTPSRRGLTTGYLFKER
ncbi:unnamed protein product [Symbiodinium sp. CCMP2592]|nr:unnamed protein product [Symbiodinium sp. CCMP2592]